MRFDCFYYPILENGKVVRTNDKIRSFSFGDKVPTKTLYYNYTPNFVIFQNNKLFIVEDGVLKQEASLDELKFPLKIVFAHGTQLTLKDRKSVV